MKKIININLAGRVIPIEDAAYDSLQRYIESLRRYFAREEGRDEIINDIESRVAELMNDKVRKGAACVTESDMEEIIGTMGRVEDFEAAEGETASAAADGKEYTQSDYVRPSTPRQRFSGRLYRDADDKFIGGVCSGIAAYINIDPAIVRIVFAIITFGGFGFGFLLYILLWILLPAQSLSGYVGKRFYRNPDDRVFGGVGGGLAAYFNMKPWTVRLIFAAPLLLNILFGIFNGWFFSFDRDIFPNFFIGSFSGTFILTYIILWIVLPLARSPYEKMEMRGERVDVNRIRQNVQEGMENFGTKAKAWGEEVKTSAQNMSDRAQEFVRTQGADFASDFRRTARPAASGIGHAIGVIFKVFLLFIAGVIAFSLFVVVLVFVFGGVARPVNDFIMDGFWQKAFMWGTVVFFLAVPLIGIITWIIRRAMNVRSQNRYLGWIFGGLWTLGWICLPLFITSLVKDFRFAEKAETEIALTRPALNKLIVKVPGLPVRYSGNYGWLNADDDQGWDITDDSVKLSNIRITVKQSEDSFYHVTLQRYANADNRSKAQERAEKIDYTVTSADSVLLLQSGFSVSSRDKFRNQRVLVEVRIPTGKQIRFDGTVADKLNPFNVRISDNERRNRYSRRNWDYEWDNNWYNEWEPDIDYYMTKDGKLQEVGKAEKKETSEKDPVKYDSLLNERQKRIDSVRRTLDSLEQINTGSEDGDVQPDDEETTRIKQVNGRRATPNALAFVPTIL